MKSGNFVPALNFVWQMQFDSPQQGYHVTHGDAGGGTYGGITEATWQAAIESGIVVRGSLQQARIQQLSDILKAQYWGDTCDGLPAGLDFLVFNGRMMTGHYTKLFQQCCGCMGDDVDGWIGPQTLGVAALLDAETLIHALTGVHFAYLNGLSAWPNFGNGWTARLKAARAFALSMRVAKPPVVMA